MSAYSEASGISGLLAAAKLQSAHPDADKYVYDNYSL